MLARVAVCWLALALTGCFTNPARPPALAEAAVGTLQLPVRDDLGPNAKKVGSLKFGDKVGILAVKRRFAQIRVEGSELEGWVDTRRLITREQMDAWSRLNEKAKDLPSQGKAIVFAPLNVHTEPFRQAPTFYQIQESESVDVVGLTSNLREAVYATPDFSRLTTRRARVPSSEKKKEEKEEPRETPKVRVAPVADKPAGKGKKKDEVVDEGPRKEGWALVRMRDGRSGWVLFNPLYLNIPEEVLQYAEGKAVTSYFELRQVEDKQKGMIREWLWTTINKPTSEYQFDGVRVFTWNKARHRYETAFRESNVRGFYPTRLKQVELKTAQGNTKSQGFVVLSEKDGKLTERTFVLDENRVRLVETKPSTFRPDPWR